MEYRKRKQNKTVSGFSLVELLIVMFIISFVSAIVFSYASHIQAGPRLSGAQREVASAIKLAQNWALEGKTKKDGNQSVTPCGFGFRVLDASTYAVYYNFKNSSFATCGEQNKSAQYLHWVDGHSVSETYTLSNRVNFETLTNPEVYFSVPRGEMYNQAGAAFGSSTDIIVKYGNESSTVTIYQGGHIVEN